MENVQADQDVQMSWLTRTSRCHVYVVTHPTALVDTNFMVVGSEGNQSWYTTGLTNPKLLRVWTCWLPSPILPDSWSGYWGVVTVVLYMMIDYKFNQSNNFLWWFHCISQASYSCLVFQCKKNFCPFNLFIIGLLFPI